MTAPLPSSERPFLADKPASPTQAEDGAAASIAVPPQQDLPVHILTAEGKLVRLNLKEVWDYRDLLFHFAWRDIKVRYKQTLLGASWAIIQPVMTMVVFTVFFGKLAKMPSDGVPYPLFAFAAVLPWQLFARSLTESSNSLLSSAHLITKVYFPRLVVPFSSVASALVDFAVALVILLGMILAYGMPISLRALTLPFFVLLTIGSALGVGLWLAALNVRYRDIRHMVGFLVQFWMFASPIAYPTSIVPEKWRLLYGLNPMVGVVEGFRWALLKSTTLNWGLLAASTAVVTVLLITGMYFFRRVEFTFADVA